VLQINLGALGGAVVPTARKPLITTKYKTLAEFLSSRPVSAAAHRRKFEEADVILEQLPNTSLDRLVSIGLLPGTADRVYAEARKYSSPE
jgi:hypothetical protein